MNKISQILSIIILATVTQSCQFSSKDTLNSHTFDEPDNPQQITPIQDWSKLERGVQLGWGSSYKRYHKDFIPTIEHSESITLTGWRNERINAQVIAWSKDSVKDLSIHISNLKSNNGIIIAEAVTHFFVRNVISDEFLGGCGYKTKSQETAHLVPDCLEEAEAFNMRAKSTRGIWFNIDIPVNADPGTYSAIVTIKVQNKVIKDLQLNLEVLNRSLPSPKNWNYQLDLWQNPYAVARMHNVELWSDEHFEKMKPLYKMLADVGQKCITASIVDKPWGGQSYDPYESMIQHKLNTSGLWEFDYSIFDKWVDFMMELGIDQQINCYSLIPWGNQLGYYDEKLERDTFIVAQASSEEFANYWIPFLEDFRIHLTQQGIFEKTTIAMDERPTEDMLNAIHLIKEHGEFKITSAANYNPGISNQIYDLSVESKHILPLNVIEERRKDGQKTTYYVCCSAEYPNNFTYSPPSEGVWQGWYAYSKNMDGFLRWAYNSWVEDPIHDTRFRTWPAGDTFFVYPGPKSSIRFEKLREGIQDYEKLQILTNELRISDKPEAQIQLQKIEEHLKEFQIESIQNEGTLKLVLKGKKLLNQ